MNDAALTHAREVNEPRLNVPDDDTHCLDAFEHSVQLAPDGASFRFWCVARGLRVNLAIGPNRQLLGVGGFFGSAELRCQASRFG